jgi:CheY-like chemotaxis protein
MNPINNYLMEKKLNCVLLIDDDEPTNFLNQIIIESAGCAEQIKTAQSGEEALNYLTSAKCSDQEQPGPDLIFLDINMPAMNGWEFLEKYRKLDDHYKGKVMIVMLTTSLFPEDKLRAKEMPEISAFENKPLTEEKLDNILKKFFEDSEELYQRKAV